MPDFWRILDRSGLKDSTAISSQLFREFFVPRADLYRQVIGADAVSEKRIRSYVDRIKPLMEDMRRISGLLPSTISSEIVRFRTRFPDFDPDRAIYVWPSLLEANGTVRPYNGNMTVFFGVDVIALIQVRWTPKVGQVGSLTHNQRNDPYVTEATSA